MGNKLQPAGLLGTITSFFFPKSLEVQVRAEQLSDGNIELIPVYAIDGQEIDPKSVTVSREQKILGYRVIADETVQSVRRQGQTKVAKRKAAEYIEQLERRGVPVRSRRGSSPLIRSVKPEVTLTLHPDDSLDVHTTLATPRGEVIEKPVDLEQLRQDEGWYITGDRLVQVSTTNTPLDNTLLTESRPSHFSGDSVPEFLKNLEALSDRVGHIEKSANLRDLDIYGEKSQNRVKVDGDAAAIHVNPSLVWLGKDGNEYDLRPEDIAEVTSDGKGYRRIPEGWIEIDPEKIAGYEEACNELRAQFGDLSNIEGSRIPETLLTLVQQDGLSSPWTVYFSQAVKNAHRLIETPAQVEFRLNVVDSDGRSLLELDPIYNHERFKLSHHENFVTVR